MFNGNFYARHVGNFTETPSIAFVTNKSLWRWPCSRTSLRKQCPMSMWHQFGDTYIGHNPANWMFIKVYNCCFVKVSLDPSKKPRIPKSYIEAVKPAAFAKVRGKATHTSGAEIKLQVLLHSCSNLSTWILFGIFHNISWSVYCWGCEPSEGVGRRDQCLWCWGLHRAWDDVGRRFHVKILWLFIATAITLFISFNNAYCIFICNVLFPAGLRRKWYHLKVQIFKMSHLDLLSLG